MTSPAQIPHPDAFAQLITLRDWQRYAVSRFNAAGLIYGHGTASASDEAAFLLLHTLHLPIDQLEPWLDCRLLSSERLAAHEVIEQRISTRKPAPYLTKQAWMQGHAFYVDERVIVPRSYIGELLAGDLEGIAPNPESVRTILDMCTGSGCLAILAALRFERAKVDGSELSGEALAVAEINVHAYGLEDRVRLVPSDLFAGLSGREYDLIIANPPYVDAEAVAAFPPEYAAEPRLAHAGGADGLDLVRRILAEAPQHLTPDGVLLVEVGRGRQVLEAEFPHLPFLWLDTENSTGEVFVLPCSDLEGAQGGGRGS